LIAAVEEERFTRIKHWAGFSSYAPSKNIHLVGVLIGKAEIQEDYTLGRFSYAYDIIFIRVF